jgi:hypothetical protein
MEADVAAQTDLTDAQFGVLKHAVTLARSGMCRRAEDLKDRLKMHGHEEADIDAALQYWGGYEKQKAQSHRAA